MYTTKIRRAQYVQQRVKQAKQNGIKVEYVVNLLANELFASRATIYRDMSRQLD